jgi:hypothetical protein
LPQNIFALISVAADLVLPSVSLARLCKTKYSIDLSKLIHLIGIDGILLFIWQ